MDGIRIGLIGINHKTADLVLREAIARGAGHLNETPVFFSHPIVLLSTCNRTEVYFSAPDLATAHSELLAYLRCFITEDFEQRLYSYFGTDCFLHLCRVTAGLDSAIFAESEIQRQVKIAYAKATEKQMLTKCLHYSFQKALKTGKLVRSKLASKNPSLYHTLWNLGDWKNSKILLIGNSEINRGFASFLMHKDVDGFCLATQNPDAVRLEGVHVRDRSILQHWQAFDLIVSASKADQYLISGKATKPCTIFDLSVPRNVDPEVEGVTLYNIEQLNGMMEQDLTKQAQGETLVWESAIRLSQIYRCRCSKTQRGLEIVGTGSHL